MNIGAPRLHRLTPSKRGGSCSRGSPRTPLKPLGKGFPRLHSAMLTCHPRQQEAASAPTGQHRQSASSLSCARCWKTVIVLVLLNLLSRLHHSESVRLVPSPLRPTIIDDEDKIEFIGHIIQKATKDWPRGKLPQHWPVKSSFSSAISPQSQFS